MKKTVALGLLLCVLLCGCEKKNPDPFPQGDGEGETDRREETSDPISKETDDTGTRIAYYEGLVNELQKELLQIKTELYVSRVEYESRIAELEAEIAENGSKGPTPLSEYVYKVEDGGAVITAYIGEETEVLVPTSIDGYPVCGIGDRAFANHADLISVTLPEAVTSIGWFAFSGCVSLERILIPSSVSTISYGAFENCTASLMVICKSDSYAAQYAKSYGIRQKAP